jgi:hypothetical protein
VEEFAMSPGLSIHTGPRAGIICIGTHEPGLERDAQEA